MKYRRVVALCAVLTIAPLYLSAGDDDWLALVLAFNPLFALLFPFFHSIGLAYPPKSRGFDLEVTVAHRNARQGGRRPSGNESSQQATQTLPAQAEIPYMDALSIQPTPSSAAVFFQKTDGTYISLQFGLTSPYPVLSPTSEATQWFSGGPKSLLDAPAGPSGTGLQSQVCAISELGSDGSEVNACAGNNSVGVSSVSSVGVTRLNYPIGPDVNSVFFADFNGDGLPDLAVAYDGNDGPGRHRDPPQQGRRHLQESCHLCQRHQATQFAVLDLNHDGFLDIATESLDQKVTVLLGKGDGTFGRRRRRTPVGGGPGRRSRLPISTATAIPTSRWQAPLVFCWAMAMELSGSGRRYRRRRG